MNPVSPSWSYENIFPLKCNDLYDFTSLLKIASSHEFSKPLLEVFSKYSPCKVVTYMSSQAS